MRTDIQALRALAVAAVFAYHLAPNGLPGGFVGVDVFFVISGFLITLHLIERPPRSGSDLVDFWGRRIRRLLPASMTVLAATVAATWLLLPETRWPLVAEHARAAALYYINWVLQAESVDYLRAESIPSVVQHYWSLAVEEQFYVLWPLLILALTLFGRRRYATGLGLVVAASFGYSIYLTAANPAAAYFSTWTRIWELGCGGLVAVAAHRGLLRSPRRGAGWLCAAGWIAIALSCFLITDDSAFPGWIAAFPILGTTLVLAAKTEYGWLAWRPIQWLGDVSYSVYLWHWPLILILPVALAHGVGSPGRGALDNVAIVGLTLLLSGLTKVMVEDRFRTRRWAGRRRATYVMGVASMIVALTLSATLHVAAQRGTTAAQRALETALAGAHPCLGAGSFDEALACPPSDGPLIPAPRIAGDDRSPVYDEQPGGDDCSSDDEDDYPLITCTFGDPNGTVDVALVGNSHAAQWAPALIDIAERRHWRITTYIAAGCVTSDARPEWDNGEDAADDCLRWNAQVVDSLQAARPDLIVLSNRTSNPVEGEDSLEASYAAWEAGYRRQLQRLSTTTTPIVIIRDTPAPENGDLDEPPDCLASRRDPEDCSGDRSEWVPADPAVNAARSLRDQRIRIIDLNDHLCTPERCGAAVGGVVAYYDGSHMTATFARTLARYLDRELRTALAKSS